MRLLSIANRLSFLVAVASMGCSSSTTLTPDAGPSGKDSGTDAGSSGKDSGTDAGAKDSAVETGGVEATLLGGSIFGFSTVPPTGPAESNPYGVEVVPAAFPKGGTLQPGDILVSNFNGASGVQGTGTTVVRITPLGGLSTFFAGAQQGLSEALAVLKSGFGRHRQRT
jgi:hypothetical protein